MTRAGELVVPGRLLPITPKERREAHLEGRPYTPEVVSERSRALAGWFRDRGVIRSDYATWNEAVQRGREQLKLSGANSASGADRSGHRVQP